ncbi:MAG: Gfo/Idh/MocA family oxidoreductase [Oscillospiraceae bacterium]|nr:Gfo/Idh/MocA family oxidoreductase [Oscillospiraceae bacterium]
MQQQFGVGVIGFGGMGSWHARTVALHLPECYNLIGSFDICPDRQEAADDTGIIAFESREALLSCADIDLVVVATPNDVHKEICIDALNHGKHVICEKPVTLSLADYVDIQAVAEANGLLFTVHQNRRWDPDYLAIKELLDCNKMGPCYNIESRVHGSRGIPGDWRNMKQHGGGMVYDWGIHLLDQMLVMMGDRRCLSVYAQLYYVTNEECDDGFRVICKFEGGTDFLVEIATNNFVCLPMWYVNSENGTAVIHDWQMNGEVVIVQDWEKHDAQPIQAGMGITKTMAPRTPETIKSHPLPEYTQDWEAYYANIYDVLANGAQPIVTHAQQRRLLRLVELIFESAEKNALLTWE